MLCQNLICDIVEPILAVSPMRLYVDIWKQIPPFDLTQTLEERPSPGTKVHYAFSLNRRNSKTDSN